MRDNQYMNERQNLRERRLLRAVRRRWNWLIKNWLKQPRLLISSMDAVNKPVKCVGDSRG